MPISLPMRERERERERQEERDNKKLLKKNTILQQ